MKIVVGISGASGAIYAKQLLEFLKKETTHEVALAVTPNGQWVLKEELGIKAADFGYPVFGLQDFRAPFVSGSALYDQMVVIPCSMGCVARMASGLAGDILTRTADVFLKERRKLIIVPRETPFSLIHLENMKTLTLAGAVIVPAVPSYYSLPQTVEEVAATVTSRVLDQMGIPNNLMKRWHC